MKAWKCKSEEKKEPWTVNCTTSWKCKSECINKFESENDIAYYQFESHDFLKEMTIQAVQQYIYMANQSTLLMGKTKRRRKKTVLMCMIKF